MADPVTMGMKAVGSIVQGVAGYRAGKQNKKALYGQAREEERAGNETALRVRDEARQVIGNQIAAQFANGFQGGSGSALDALKESQINATLDVLEVRREAISKARSLRAKGKQALEQGKFALASGILGAGSSISSGMSDWAAAGKGSSVPPSSKP